MKRIAIGLWSLLLLTRCSPDTESTTTQQLLGSWKNATADNIITFDGDNTYTIRFGASTTFSCSYRLEDLKGDKSNRLYIYDTPGTYKCTYRFLEDDQLELTRLSPPRASEVDQIVSVYRRVLR